MNDQLQQYIQLAKRFSLFRVHRNGKASAQKKWQQRCLKKVPFDVNEFFDHKGKVMNAGIACGPASGIIVVDIDDSNLFQEWCQENDISNPTPDTFTVRSGGKSDHYYYEYPTDNNEYRKCKVPGVDILGTGSYAIAPGSIHPETGKPYFISNNITVAPAPRWVLDALLGKMPKKLVQVPSGTNPTLPTSDPSSNVVVKGDRNQHLISVAGNLINQKLSPDAVKAALMQENNTVCSPPLDINEVDQIYNSITRYPATEPIILTHQGFADIFAKEHLEKIRFNYETGEWYVWDGKRWKADKSKKVYPLMKNFLRGMYTHACSIPGNYGKALKQISRKFENSPDFDKIIKRTQTVPLLTVPSDVFDKDPGKLNCSNGTIDLRTGRLLPHNPDDMITKVIHVEYDPAAEAPVFQKFMNSVMGGNVQLINYLQKSFGYSFTGETKEQCYFILYGTGSNGKTTLMNALKGILGEFAADVDFKCLTNSNGRAREDLVKTVGIRLLTSSEVDPNKTTDETVINRITGNETFTVKKLYNNPFDFTPQFKLFIFGNHKPNLQSFNYATRRRIRFIPFTQCFKGSAVNKDLPKELEKEYPGILRWVVEGARLWYESGLETPDIVEAETQGYINEIDTVSKFLDEEFEQGSTGDIIPSSELNNLYAQWCKQNGETAIGKKNFAASMKDKGYIKKKVRGKEHWVGIRRRPFFPQAPPQQAAQ